MANFQKTIKVSSYKEGMYIDNYKDSMYIELGIGRPAWIPAALLAKVLGPTLFKANSIDDTFSLFKCAYIFGVFIVIGGVPAIYGRSNAERIKVQAIEYSHKSFYNYKNIKRSTRVIDILGEFSGWDLAEQLLEEYVAMNWVPGIEASIPIIKTIFPNKNLDRFEKAAKTLTVLSTLL